MTTKITPSMRHVLQQIAADKSPHDLTEYSGSGIVRALDRCNDAGLYVWRTGKRQLTEAGRAALAQGDEQ